ncbi:DUF3450 domain-containing protein [Halioxenophilus sp. WMMB6]|uniref:DUF3450 domain-containing protein n=1 Tax=Halioxenophilus sp. WMMB6 TaxID=3073815 RepID=UPI00295F461C|nr:DUF3450 domain-containing protein [Halioxenophilus sp. WMMB6]
MVGQSLFLNIFLLVIALVSALPLQADTTQPVLSEGEQRLLSAQQSQQQIDAIYEDTQAAIKEYETRLDSVDSLDVYNRLLARQLHSQQEEITTLQNSIADAAVIERRITPLMERMINSLAEFVELDMPFLLDERRQRVDGLRAMLARSDVSTAEKCRRVFEAFEIENEFGRSIESYKSQLQIDGKSYDAEVLRVGRIALLYSLIGQHSTGYWDVAKKQWQVDNSSAVRRFVEQGLKVAAKETPPEMINIPIAYSSAK